jgi:hypothetical protein
MKEERKPMLEYFNLKEFAKPKEELGREECDVKEERDVRKNE